MTQHRARKRFGQHFLTDPLVLDAMVNAIAPQSSDHLVEIGPGLAALTQHLVHAVKRFDAIEIDRDLVKHLETRFAAVAHFHLHCQDVLQFPWNELQQGQLLRVVGNLPYNISTPLMFRLFDFATLVQDMYFLLQREVAERIAAVPSTKQYGRLSIMAQYFCEATVLFTVPASAFQPPPKVESAFIRLIPRPLSALNAADPVHLRQLVTAVFNHRRKTVGNCLKTLMTTDTMATLAIDPTLRPENLSVADYVRISNYLTMESNKEAL